MSDPCGECSNHCRSGGISRRSALAIVMGGSGALVAGALGLAAGFISNALGRRSGRDWLRIGPAEELDAETFQRRVVHVTSQHAWIRERRPLTVYIKDLYPEDPIAFLSVCSHLGCSVNWEANAAKFRCPCHGGEYDERGRVISGPPPRPLTKLDVKIEGDVCFVRLPVAGEGAPSA